MLIIVKFSDVCSVVYEYSPHHIPSLAEVVQKACDETDSSECDIQSVYQTSTWKEWTLNWKVKNVDA